MTPSSSAPTRVLIVEDHVVMREGLRVLLEPHGDIEIVGETGDGSGAIRLADELHPDVVVMDIALPHVDGIVATREIRARRPATQVIALSANFDERSKARALAAGAASFVPKTEAFSSLAQQIRAARLGQAGTAAEPTQEEVAALPDVDTLRAELSAARDDLTQQRLRYDELLDFAPGALLLTAISGVILEANAEAGTLLNVPSSHLVGKPFSNFVEASALGAYREGIRRLRSEGALALHLQLQPRRGTKQRCAVKAVVSSVSFSGHPIFRWHLEVATEGGGEPSP